MVSPARQAAKKRLNTKPQSEHQDHEDTDNYNFNLSLCLLWFLGGFVFKDFFAKKNKDFACNIIEHQKDFKKLRHSLFDIRYSLFF